MYRILVLTCALVGAAPIYALAAAPSAVDGISWQVASTDADVDRAFALARQQGKPLFFYWGAVWCPPCNQVKATLFSRPDFVERSRTFIPVYVDGDKPGAQKVASRFKVTGYPTMVLFKPDGTELTRLPGEVDPERYLLTLNSGLEAQAPAGELVKMALAHKPLTPQQWQLLAFYSWDTDQQQIFKTREAATRLGELAAAAPPGAIQDRLALKAVAARVEQEGAPVGEKQRSLDLQLVEKMLAGSDAANEQQDLLVLYAEGFLKYLAPSADARSKLAQKWDSALAKSPPRSRIESLDLLDARVELWKAIDRSQELSPTRRDSAKAEVLRIVSQTTDKYERQALVPSAAHVLASAGLVVDSDALLKSELSRAVAPYYHMLGIAANAKQRGDKQEALRWYEEAWRKSEGPATRLQWGAGYLRELTSLAPSDAPRIEAAAKAVISELEVKPETFYERNQRSLQKIAGYLLKWQGTDTARMKFVGQLKRELSSKCARLPKSDAGRANCDSVFSTAPGTVS